MPSVLIIDDILLVRQGLKQLLNPEFRGLVFGEAKTGEEAAMHLARRPWDVVFLEISIPGQDGFQLLREIHRRYPSTRLLILSLDPDPQCARRVRQLWASGYIGRNASRADILKAFRTVLAGGDYFEESPLSSTAAQPAPRHASLSSREDAVMSAFVAGKRVGEIAIDLNLSAKTVSTYKRRMLDKLGLRSTAELVRYAIDKRRS